MTVVSAMIPSPNHYNGRRGQEVDTIVYHYTASRGSAFSLGKQFQRSRNSAHFGIDRDGTVAQYVSIRDAAWHAGDGGASRLPSLDQVAETPDGGLIPLDAVRDRRKMNLRSIGIEHSNCGYMPPPGEGVQAKHANPRQTATLWDPYTTRQIDSTITLTSEILEWLPLHGSPLLLCGHEDVCHPDTLGTQWGGKFDPGPVFPWPTLERELPGRGLIRVWYDHEARGWRVKRWL